MSDKLDNRRSLRFESLEDRRVLSATGLEGEPSDTVLVTSTSYGDSDPSQSNEIVELIVDVNGEQQVLTADNNLLELVEGDTVQVVEINFHSTATQGVFAAEGYVNKINDLSSASLIDYNDGRFSERAANAEATGGNGSIGGLGESWQVQSGWDRMTINLMHYTESSTDVAGRFFVQMQVGQADFEFDTEFLDTIKEQQVEVGDEVKIPARWFNGMDGTFHNYAEVDIYHSSDLDTIVWAGAAVGNVGPDNVVEGEFINTREDDSFSKYWTPAESGEYVLKYYLDPEAVVAETNEFNNEYEVRVQVDPEMAPEAVDDHFDSPDEDLDVLANDEGNQPKGDLEIADFTQPENGEVSLNEDGTLKYTPEDGFYGQDEFTYSITDGRHTSNDATVTVDVTRDFEVVDSVSGDEDTQVDLTITAEYDTVEISGVPKHGFLSAGEVVDSGVYVVKQSELEGLQVTLPPQSDADFQLTVTPMVDGNALTDLSKTIDVQVNAVVDGGTVRFYNFGILTGSSGRIPVASQFDDLDGSEDHQIRISGLPDFISLQSGVQDGSDWVLAAEDLKKLEVDSERADDISGWSQYFDRYAYKPFDLTFEVTSTESSNGDTTTFTGNFRIYVWQKL